LEITGDYWRLLENTAEVTGEYWILLQNTVEVTGEYWRLLEFTGDYWIRTGEWGVHNLQSYADGDENLT